MWQRWLNWRNAVNEETLLVLKHPEMAPQIKGCVRRWIAMQLVKLTPIERQQLHDFLLKRRRGQAYLAAVKLMLLFSAIGILVHLMFPSKLNWIKVLLLSNFLGFVLAWALIGIWFNYRKIVQNKFKTAMLILFPCIFGVLTGVILAAVEDPRPLNLSLEHVARVSGLALLVAALLYMVPIAIVAMWRNRQYEALAAKLEQDAERERMARELSDSQLRLLRAQIEPHFLFNTLGAVQQLAEQGAPKAAALTADLIAFLRASLDKMRSEQVPLQSEFDMVAAYLRVMQARMGARLHFNLDLPPSLAHTTVPSMIVLTLAENAIKHGIEPALRGGEIHISAALEGSMLRLRVRDTGMGLVEHATTASDGGLGLDNIRSRLQLVAQHDGGPAGSLEVRNGEESGVIADILLPYKTSTEGMA
ncbi:histidine kinase [Janthinobacterium sp.]|uniref:sensor histidine kinase n=1 Tax=Janthinobacterium sp. TaxID=1871054 RepID=UPI00261D8C4D|nr:histidine kinase [Janthinobacterium sp.]